MLIAPNKFRSLAMIVLFVTTDPGAQKSTIAPCKHRLSSVALLREGVRGTKGENVHR
jgi:hypothetical protein